jgi:hypothetical protein
LLPLKVEEFRTDALRRRVLRPVAENKRHERRLTETRRNFKTIFAAAGLAERKRRFKPEA